MIDRSLRVLVVVDASNFEYVCMNAAASKWERLHADEAASVLKDKWHTDQDNLPDLLNHDSFRRVLRFTVQDKLDAMRGVVSTNHGDFVDFATGADVIFAVDGELEKNFRKRLYPEYKAQRTKERKRFSTKGMKTYIQNVLFKELGVETALGFKVVAVEGCESDDIIAVIMRKYTDYPCRILFSSDKDFLQLKDVFQYNCWGKRVVRTIPDVVDEEVSRKDFLLWKIIRGDLSDNIKNVFPKYGDKKSWKLVQDRPELTRMLKESNAATERFMLNSTLIDFRHIPEENVRRIEKAVADKLAETEAEDEFGLEGCMVV